MKYILIFLLISNTCYSQDRILKTDSTLYVYGGYNKITYWENIKPKQEKRVDTPIYEILPSLYPKVIKKVTYFGYEIEAFGRQLEVGKEYEVIDEGLCENLNCPSYCYTIKGISSVGHRLNGRVPFDTLVFSKRKYAPKFEEIFKIDTIITRDTITKTWIDTIKVSNTKQSIKLPRKAIVLDNIRYIPKGTGYRLSNITNGSSDTVIVTRLFKIDCGCNVAEVHLKNKIPDPSGIKCFEHRGSTILQEYDNITFMHLRRLNFL